MIGHYRGTASETVLVRVKKKKKTEFGSLNNGPFYKCVFLKLALKPCSRLIGSVFKHGI